MFKAIWQAVKAVGAEILRNEAADDPAVYIQPDGEGFPEEDNATARWEDDGGSVAHPDHVLASYADEQWVKELQRMGV